MAFKDLEFEEEEDNEEEYDEDDTPDNNHYSPEVFETILGPNSSVKRVELTGDFRPSFEHVLTAGEANLESLSIEYGASGSLFYREDCEYHVACLEKTIPRMAKLKELRVIFRLLSPLHALGVDEKNSFFGAIEESASIRKVGLIDEANVFTGMPVPRDASPWCGNSSRASGKRITAARPTFPNARRLMRRCGTTRRPLRITFWNTTRTNW